MKKRTRIILFALVILAAAAGAVFFAVNFVPAGEGASIINERLGEYDTYKYKDGFLTFNGRILSAYDYKAEEKWVIDTEENSSSLSVTEDMILVYSKDSGRVRLIDGGKVRADYYSDKNIRSAAVNPSGYAVILSSDSGYKGQCSVYTDKGERVSRYSYGKKYIVAAFLADDNKSLFMNVIDESENMFKGKIVFSDIKKGEIKAEIETEGIAPFTAVFKNTLIVSDDTALRAYSKNGTEKWNFLYEGGRAEFIKCSGNTVTAVIKDSSAIGSTKVVSLSTSGRLKGAYLSEIPIDAFDVSRGYSAIKTGNEIKLLNRHGKAVAFTECDANTYDILLYKNKNRVLALSGSAEMKIFGR